MQFAPQDNTLMLVAGVWDTWTNHNTHEVINSFAIITDNPCDYVLKVGHDRQPDFLSESNAKIWLENRFNEPQDAYNFLKNNQQPINYTVANYKQLNGFINYDLFS